MNRFSQYISKLSKIHILYQKLVRCSFWKLLVAITHKVNFNIWEKLKEGVQKKKVKKNFEKKKKRILGCGVDLFKDVLFKNCKRELAF